MNRVIELTYQYLEDCLHTIQKIKLIIAEHNKDANYPPPPPSLRACWII